MEAVYKNDGFTLLEILVALAIVAILSAAVAPSLIGQVSEKRVTATNKKLDHIQDAVRMFYSDTLRMPPDLKALISNRWDFDKDGDIDAADSTVIDYLYPGWKGPYLTDTYDFVDLWGRQMQYRYDLDGDETNVEDMILCPPLPNITAAIFSYGRGERRFGAGGNLYNVYGTGHSNNTAFDNDGDGTIDEDGYNGIDDDGDGLIDEDPPEGPFVFNDDDQDAITNPATGACNAAGVDEDIVDGIDNDGDGATDEDPPNDPKTGVMFRTVSVLPVMLEKKRIATTNMEMNEIRNAVLAFYDDTAKMPPNLASLVSNEWDTNNDAVINAVDTAYISANYTGWNGPYVAAGPPYDGNPAFIDGWGKPYIYLFNNEANTLIQSPNILNVDLLEFNPAQPNINALLISLGPNQLPDITGTGTTVPNIDNDGDGTTDEDEWDDSDADFFLDDDGDSIEDEDPSDARFMLSVNPIETGDIYLLISVGSVDTDRLTRTKEIIDSLNLAATQYVASDGDSDNNNGQDEEQGLISGADDDGDGFIDEDLFGLDDLDARENAASLLPGAGPGGAFNFLMSEGWVSGSYQQDQWGNNILWDAATNAFFSTGPNGVNDGGCGFGDDIC